jgi:hypothetical protein
MIGRDGSSVFPPFSRKHATAGSAAERFPGRNRILGQTTSECAKGPLFPEISVGTKDKNADAPAERTCLTSMPGSKDSLQDATGTGFKFNMGSCGQRPDFWLSWRSLDREIWNQS